MVWRNKSIKKDAPNGSVCEIRHTGGVRKKDEEIYGKILAIFLFGMLLLSVSTVLMLQSKNDAANQDTNRQAMRENFGNIKSPDTMLRGIPHAPLTIKGNSGFTPGNGVVRGSGIPTDPYIIEGWDIDAHGGTYCIWIENTDMYFVIRNCYVHNATSNSSYPTGTGINLRNVHHGTISNIYATGNNYGIALDSSSNNTISNNYVNGNPRIGISFVESSGNTITNNNVSDNTFGIHLSSSSNNNIITNNNASNNIRGIYVGYSNNNLLTNNNASGNHYGICLESTSSNILTNNNASDNAYSGIYLTSSSSNNIAYNMFCCNAYYGVDIERISTANSIHHNTFIANKGASKGAIDSKSQAYDDVGGNYWYDATAKEGNCWSNWDGNGWGTADAYPIDGGKASDWYPLGKTTSNFVVNLALSKLEVAGITGAEITATVTVMNGSTPVPDVDVSLVLNPSTGLSAETGKKTDSNGKATIKISITQNFSVDTIVSVTAVATISGNIYGRASSALTVRYVPYAITLTLEQVQIEGKKDKTVNATVSVTNGSTPMQGISVKLTATPSQNIRIAPTTATTDVNGCANFTIKLTSDFTQEKTVTIEPRATIEGLEYGGAPETLTITSAPPVYEVSITLETTEIEGKNGSLVRATISVISEGRGVPNLTVTVIFDTTGLTASPGLTDQYGRGVVPITICQDFTTNTLVKVIPKVAGVEYQDKAVYLMINAKGTSGQQNKTPGFDFTAVIALIAIASLFAYARRKEH